MSGYARRLEELTLNSSAPAGQLVYDGWLLRFSPGNAKRARSINAVYPSRIPLGDKLAYCERVYRERGLPAIFRISAHTEPPELDGMLEARGYAMFSPTQVRAAEIDPAKLTGAEVPSPRLEEWFDMIGDLRGSTIAHRSAHLARLSALPLEIRTAALSEAGVPLAVGLAIREDDHAGIFDVVTRESARRRGLARAIVVSLLQWGYACGARRFYLQVEENNAPAIALYESFGFATVYRYWYRGRPGETT